MNPKNDSNCDILLPDWKRLWQLVSGIHYAPPENTVKELLSDVSKELQDGILQFKNSQSTEITLEKLLKEKKQDKLLPFTNKLQQLLDLETKQCWEILCYYLTNEYRGTASSLTTLTSTENNMTKLLDDIWGYYTLERMIVLKIVKNLLEFYENDLHPYYSQYKNILDQIKLENLKKSYIKQFEYLVKETPPHKLTSGEFINYQTKLIDWNERNCRETIEVLHILLLIVHFCGINCDDFKKIYKCFKSHSFGRHQSFLNDTNEIHIKLKTKIMHSELALFLRCVDVVQSKTDSIWIKEIVDALDNDILILNNNPEAENGPILLSWMLLNFRNVDENSDNSFSTRKYRQMGGRAVKLNVFEYLKNLVATPMFSDKSFLAIITRKTIYNHLGNLCDLFDDDGSVSQHNGIFDLLSELLCSSEIATEFCSNEDSGCRSLYNTALEYFPVDFISLSKISSSLLKAGMSTFVKEQLENLPIYAEQYDGTRIKLQSTSNIEDEEYLLFEEYSPFNGIDYKIAEGTSAAITRRPNGCFIHFRTTITYFNVLHNEINLLLSNAVQYTEIDHNRLKRINIGIKLLSLAINVINSPNEITQEMVHPTEMCIDILNKFKNIQDPPLELLANCLNVCTSLLPFFKNEIFARVSNLNILPFVSHDHLDFKKYAHGMSFDSCLVGSYLINIERKEEKYDFLFAYLKFLHKYTIVNAEDENNQNRLFQMEIPGLIFLLREVFPHVHSWRFRQIDDRNLIYKETMDFICDILDTVSADKLNPHTTKTILRDMCVYSLLNLDNGIILLRFIAIGNPFLQSSMEMESNWLISTPVSIISLVRQSMRILMHLLRLKTTIFESTIMSPLESLIYTQPKQRDTLRIIPVVTSYMNNIFDQSLPILSCRLLRRIALEFKMSLLACLDMEPDQIRLIFLQRLPNDLESDNLKIAILEFVEACIEKQPGLTEAFFKINSNNEKRLFATKEKETNIGDSIIPFMEIYLNSVADMPNIIEGQLPSCIMSLFHALWKNNMQSLIIELTNKADFWSSLCSPFFCEKYKQNVKGYSQILNVIGLEIFCCQPKQKLNENLQKLLNEFFEKQQFEKWLNHVFDLPQEIITDYIPDETAEWLSRLQSFKDFIVIVLKKNIDELEIEMEQRKLLARKCLKILVERSEYTDDLRPFVILAELYLIILSSFMDNYRQSLTEDNEMLSQIIKLFSNVAVCYEDLHVRAKESCLSITIKIAELLASELVKNSSIALSFLNPVVTIICYELNDLERTVKSEVMLKKGNNDIIKTLTKNNSLTLSLNLLKSVASIFHNEGPANWDSPFISNRVFNRLLSSTSFLLQLCSKQQLSIELLDVLIVFAKGNCSNELLHCDISAYLWLKLLPPKELFQAPYLLQPHNQLQNQQQQQQQLWTAQLWWPIYSRGIELITILFQKYNYQFLTDSLLFVGIHEEYLVDSMLLAKQSFETNAIILVKNTVHLISELVEYQKEWRLEHSHSLFNLMRCVQILMGHSISLFNQQRNLRRLMTDVKFQTDSLKDVTSECFTDDIINSMNSLTEIITICAKSLLKFSPSILDLICEPQFSVCKWEPLFEIQFGPPKLNDNNVQLTFGTVLSIIPIFTKALNVQGYGFHEIPLNSIPTKSQDTVDAQPGTSLSPPGQQTLNSNDNLLTISQRGNYSKSISVASVASSSTAVPSNEILSNIDGELCQMALENILTLVASQSLLALKNANLSNREKQLIRREISTELITFNEFVRKKVLNDLREYRDIWHRKKRGISMMIGDNDNSIENISVSPVKPNDSNRKRSSDYNNSMRVNVVRRLHLDKRKTPLTPQPGTSKQQTFDMTQDLSPIVKKSQNSKTDLNAPPAISTPNLSRPSIHKDDNISDRLRMDIVEEEIDEEIEFFAPEEPTYSPLSFVIFVEEDYLQLLSNIFTVICHSD